MKLNIRQQETLMYQSRLLFKHNNVESASDRSLAFTIHVKDMPNTEQFKRAVYQKIHRAIYGAISSRQEVREKFNKELKKLNLNYQPFISRLNTTNPKINELFSL